VPPVVTLFQFARLKYRGLAARRSGRYTQRKDMAIAAATAGSTSSARNPMPLSAVIVDDEQLARDELAYLLKNLDDINVVAQGKNGLEAISLIREHNPDLVFLDVQMPGLDGFGVIKKLLDRKVPLPKIIFATAFDQYAVKAFDVNAVDYILKPFDKKRVAQSIERARAKIEAGAGPEEKLETLMRMLESQKPQTAKVLIKAAGRLFLADPKDICYATIEDGVITVATSGHAGMEGHSNCRTLEETFRQSRPPICSGARTGLFWLTSITSAKSCPGSKLLPVTHGRQETDGDSGEPRPDPPPAGIIQPVKRVISSRFSVTAHRFPSPQQLIPAFLTENWELRTKKGRTRRPLRPPGEGTLMPQ